MNITTLTNSSLINLQTTYADRDTAIKALAEQLDLQGRLHDKEEFLAAVFAREEHGATAKTIGAETVGTLFSGLISKDPKQQLPDNIQNKIQKLAVKLL